MIRPIRDSATEGRREQILAATRQVVRDGGIEAVRLSDIAGVVGIARPNLYRYFAGKEDLIKAVVLREIDDVHRRRQEHVDPTGRSRQVVVESLLVGAEMAAHDDMVIAAARSSDYEVMARLVSHDEDVLAAEAEYWTPLLERGRAGGEIVEHLSDDRIIRWFMTCQLTLASRPELAGSSVRSWIEDFVVPPVVREVRSWAQP